ncbi:MAG: condensation domain-containing protein [Clostridiaceae bacterium]
MKYEINKERLWIFSPVNHVVIKADISIENKNQKTSNEIISESIDINALREAIDCAVNSNEVLKSKIVLEDDGKAYFVGMQKANYSVTESGKYWQTIVKEQEKIPFDIQNGEYLRFYIIRNVNANEADTTLLLIAHHLAGDGTSYAYLLQDIIRALNGEKIVIKPVEPFDMSSLPKDSRLGFIMRLMLSSMNKKWRKTGKQFTFNEQKEMNSKYWSAHSSYVTVCVFAGSTYDSLIAAAKANRVSVNTVITAAFIKAANECGETNAQDVGHAVSIRKKGYTGMGNFATGISMKYLYDGNKGFFENAKCIQKLIYKKINDDKKKYFLLQFMGNITGTLCDAIYFAAVAGYGNKTALNFCKMFGYDGNPKGISITNLTKLPIEKSYGDYEITDFVFVPPLVLNAKRIIGIASLGNRMEISFCVEDDGSRESNVRFFANAMNTLESLVSLLPADFIEN